MSGLWSAQYDEVVERAATLSEWPPTAVITERSSSPAAAAPLILQVLFSHSTLTQIVIKYLQLTFGYDYFTSLNT